LLVVEVLSPSTARYDRITKRMRYQRSGVGEYWVVDVWARAIERWTPHDARPEVLDERITWHPAGASAPLVIDLEDFFRSAMPG
jgi:Uma2 family endonuclease